MANYGPHRGPDSHVLTPVENAKGGSARSDVKRAAVAENGRAFLARFRDTEEARQAVRRGGHTWGKKTSAMRRKCNGCDLVTTPGALGQHQAFGSHTGYIELPPEETP